VVSCFLRGRSLSLRRQPSLPCSRSLSQFEKATIVAKLKVARDRKRAETGKCGGQRSMAETRPELVELARRLRHTRSGRQRSLREISAELTARGFLTAKTGKPFPAAQVARMLRD
jgi:hypothetical protein